MREVSQVINGKRVIVKKPELLAPAGNLEKLKVAILYGADAVFIGGKEFSLRSSASNFSLEDIQEAVEFAHTHHAAIHVTCNIILHEDNLKGLEEYLLKLDEIGVDAIIVADPYIMSLAKKLHLKLEVHVSTQLSTMNTSAIRFYENLGVDRVVFAREVDYQDLKEVREKVDIDLEYFIHGAMCIHYSGRCMLSNYFSRRDANRGGCSQSCRWYYDIFEKDQQLNHDEIVPFSMSSKDMSLVDELPKLIELGIDSFKIEGRMKSLHYIATVVSTYRKLIDTYCDEPENFDKNGYRKEIEKAANRALCTGFFKDVPNSDYQLYNQRDEHPTQDFCARVLSYDVDKHEVMIEQRNYFKVGDQIEFFSPHHENVLIEVKEIYNEDRESVEVANHPMEILYLKCEQPLSEFDMGRKVLTNEK